MKQRSEIEIAAIEWAKAHLKWQHMISSSEGLAELGRYPSRNPYLELEGLAHLRLLVLCTAEIAEESEVVEPAPERAGIEAKA